MGVNEMLEEEEQKNDVAKTILLKAEAIKECEHCSDYKNNFDDEALTNAYKIGNSMITKEDEVVGVFKGDRKALSDRIKSVYSDTNWKCHCEQIIEEE